MQFLQSVQDFPQMVRLGDKMPFFGLHRFRQGLRFVPVDDDDFSLRGNKQYLLYKGRRRSHRFTILGDSSFEYDCILLKEPDSNIIRLRIEGAENYDFLRQPDFVKDPFLQGSYAVYKKQTLHGEGTGKLCHIHRPEIIDARGRRCWGKLAVVGNELLIIIPEKWLGEAAYPVIVDPVVGTATVGAFNSAPNGYFNDYPVYFSKEMAVEQFIMPADLDGQASVYVYSDNTNWFDNFRPVIYENNNINMPYSKLYYEAGNINKKYPIENNLGWQWTWFSVNNLISTGTTVWFGFYADYLYPRFDYGGSLITTTSWHKIVYDVFPYEEVYFDDYRVGLKLSMYFDYQGRGDNYMRTLVETGRVNDNVLKAQTFFRKGVVTARVNMALNASIIAAKICHIIDNLIINSRLFPFKFINVKLYDQIKTQGALIRKIFIVLQLKTNSLVRSIFNKRFLNSKVEITLKSRIGETNRSEK